MTEDEVRNQFTSKAANVVLQGGGKDGWAYTRESALAQALSAYRMGNPWPFIPTGRVETFTHTDKSKNIHPYDAEIWLYDKTKLTGESQWLSV